LPPFRELVTVAGTGEISKRARRAAAGADDLKTTAWLVHQHMLGEAQRTHSPEIPDVESGATWLKWAGTLVSSLRELQLVQTPSRGDNDTVTDTITRRHTAEYLKRTGNAVCLHSTNGTSTTNPTIWAIRTEFREHTVEEGVVNLTGISRVSYGGKKPTSTVNPAQPKQRTGTRGPGRPPRSPNSRESRRCPTCGNLFDIEQVVRHMRITHRFDPVPVLLDFIKAQGPLNTLHLANCLSDVCGGGIVSSSYVNEMLQPLVFDSKVPLVTKPGDNSRFAYHWEGRPGTKTTEEPAVTLETAASSSNHDTSPVVIPALPPAFRPPATSIPGTAPTAPSAVAAVPQIQEARPASEPSSVAHLNGTTSSLPPSQVDANFGTVLDALQRARQALDNARATLDDASEAAAAIVTENQELRGYQSRVQRLLDVADSLKTGS
jgi:hypothetical protein